MAKPKYDPNKPEDNPVHQYDKRFPGNVISHSTAVFRRDDPMNPANVRARKTVAMRTIREQVFWGYRLNPKANTSAYYKAAVGNVKPRPNNYWRPGNAQLPKSKKGK